MGLRQAAKYVYGMLPRVDISSLYTEAPRAAGRIPNHVYQTWISPVLPVLIARGIRRFRKMNPDYSFSFYDDRRMASYMEANYAGHPITKIFGDVRVPAVKADIWRYCILYKEGGVYCDIKSALKVPLREVLPDNAAELVSFERNAWRDYLDLGRYADPDVFLPAPPDSIRAGLEHPENIICNWFLCFEKGSPILETLIELIVRHSPFFRGRIFEKPTLGGNHFTGPLALTQAVWMWMLRTGKRPGQGGIDVRGQGIWRLRGMDYRKSPHHATLRNLAVLD